MAKSRKKAERVEEARRLLDDHVRREGLRRTRQREVILDAFLAADAHMSVEELYDAIRRSHPSVGAATVYRTMNLFVKAGLAKERRFHDGCSRFEPAVAAGHHDHLICTACGGIQEFEDDEIERLQGEIAARLGFEVRSHRLELYGLCAKCR